MDNSKYRVFALCKQYDKQNLVCRNRQGSTDSEWAESKRKGMMYQNVFTLAILEV